MSEQASPSVLKGAGVALIAFAVFATHDATIKSIDDIPSFQVVFFVVLFSFVPFTFMLAVDATERSLRPNLPGLVGLRCLFTSGGLLCVFHAFQNLPLAEVYSLLFSSPMIITLLAIPLLGEKVKLIRWIAILMGLAGVFVVLQPGAGSLSVHHLAGLGAAICVACTSVVTRKIGPREHSVVLILYPMLTNVLISGILMSQVYVPMPGTVLLKLAAIGILSVTGQALMIHAYRISEAQFVAPMQYSQMLWALLYGSLIFGETVDSTVLMGSAIIVLSGLLFIWRELVVSVTRPVLSTRNLRQAGGPQSAPREADQQERAARGAHRRALRDAVFPVRGAGGPVGLASGSSRSYQASNDPPPQ